MLYLRLFIFFFTSLLFIFKNSYSQDTNTIKYLPLAVGNTWVYYYTTSSFQGYGSGFEIYKITGTTTINGKLFFSTQHTIIYITGTYGCSPRLFTGGGIRVDSFSCNIYGSSNCNSYPEVFIDSLHSKLRDTAFLCSSPPPNNKDICNDTSMYNIFGLQFPSKKFENPFFEGDDIQIYARNIGVVFHYHNLGMSTCNSNLLGCIINGQLYGDTSTVLVINQISREIPKSFSLSQNYPNPFNPTTKIRFNVPNAVDGRDRSVRLVIYDVLGREVATLVNEQLQPGTYEAQWDASSYPSGVYFYRIAIHSDKLEAGNFSQTKKLVLIK